MRTYLCVAGCAGWAPESLLLEFMEDDRFLLRAHDLWEGMVGEAEAIEQLPPWFWQNLVEVVHDMDVSATSLRDQVLTSVRVSMSYLEQEVYDQLQS